jgi:hypothetical protein
MTFRHEFVTSVPVKMDEAVLYVSFQFSTTMHLCPCGCGSEIANKISPSRWQLSYDGETVSLFPSIGNWSLACQSHYWISKNEIHWAEKWSKQKIARGRNNDKKAMEVHQKKTNSLAGKPKKSIKT